VRNDKRGRRERLKTAFLFAAILLLITAEARAQPAIPPGAVGSTIEAVRVDVKGIADRFTVMRYLAAKPGMKLQASLIEGDYHRLAVLGYYRAAVLIESGHKPGTVIVHWTVVEPWIRLVANTRYSDPMNSVRKGAGFTVSSRSANNGAHPFFQTWVGAFTHDFAAGVIAPINVSSVRNSEQDFVGDVYADFEANQYANPAIATIFNKTAGLEAEWLVRTSSGIRYGIKLRDEHATSAAPSGIVSSSVLPINGVVVKSFLVIAGISSYCYGPASICPAQYRLQFTDGIGAFGASSEFQSYVADASRYFPINAATAFAIRAATTRTGGVVPTQDLPQLDDLRGYKKPFYGTDDEVFQAELRFNDMRPRSIQTFIFTETGGYRFRNGVGPYNPQTFTFNADSGFGFMWRSVGIVVAHGNTGYLLKAVFGPAF
jgi:hypothetical protein